MRRHALRLLPALLAVITILAALPAAAAPGCVLHEKSAQGLMPPVCLPDPAAPQLASDAPAATFLGAPVSASVGSWAQVLAAGRFDGSGRELAAVLTARYFDTANDERLHLYRQDGTTLSRLQQLPAGADPAAAIALDADHDGRADLIGALAGDNELALFPQGEAYFSPTLRLAQPGAPDALASGDFNGDLRPDAAVTLPLSDTLALWSSSPRGLRASGLKLPFPSDGYNALAVGDFNNDGYDDLAALRGSGDPSSTRQDLVTVFFQDQGTFPVSITLSPEMGGYLPHSLAVGDLNGDGRDDLAVTAGGNMPNAFLNLYLQGAAGLATTPTVISTYHLPTAVVVADVNHDGREDVIIAHDGWRYVSVFPQGSDGALGAYVVAQIPYSDRYRPQALAVADLSGDGGLDVVLVSRTPGLTVLNNTQGAPTALISSPAAYATVPAGEREVTGTASAGTTAVEVRVKGLTGWAPAALSGSSWSAMVNLPADSPSRSWWVEARAISGERYQAPPARVRVRATGRVRAGLLAEYLFDERGGATIHDSSGVGAPLDLTLADEDAASRVPAGLFVHSPARIASGDPAHKVTDALKTSNAFTLEAWVRTANLKQDGPARIMTLSDDSQHLNVSLVQSRLGTGPAQLGLRLNTSTPPAGEDRYDAFAELPLSTDLTHILVARGADGTLIFYINGVEQGRSQAPGDFSSWSDSYQLIFGNDALAERPWLGEYHLAAIYQRALTPAEVIQNYAAGPIGDGSPAQITDAQLVYTFDEGSGATVGDSALVLPALPAQIADLTKVSWGAGSLHVNAPTIIATDGPATKVSRASMATGEICVEAWVAPANTTQNGPARIVTISQNTSQRNLSLGQGLWGTTRSDRYSAQLRSTATSANGEPHLDTPPGSLSPALSYVVYTRDAAGNARLFVDGEERASRTIGGDLSNWASDYRLALANEFTMNRAWLGAYHYLAISSRALTPAQVAARYALGPADDAPPPSTSIGPFVQQVMVNGGAETTAGRTITLDITVDTPAGQVLGQLTVAEYGFDAQQQGWKLLQRGSPTPAATGSSSWTLKPGAGVRYLQVWATDSAGATSSYPYQTFINLIPASVDLAERHTTVYRFGLRAGESFHAQVAVRSGDADLYVWGPAGDMSMRWVSNGRNATEQVSFTAPVDGVYQVEVYGHRTARYALSVTHGAASPALRSDALIAEAGFSSRDAAKEVPDAPAISVDSAPSLDRPSDTLVYLPLVTR